MCIFRALPPMNVSIDFDLTSESPAEIILHRQANPMEHESSGFLGHANGSVKLPGRNTVAAVHHLPDCRQPLLQNRLENPRKWFLSSGGTSPEGVFRSTSSGVHWQGSDMNGTASRTFHRAVRPAKPNHELPGGVEVLEVLNLLPVEPFAIPCINRLVREVYLCPHCLTNFCTLPLSCAR